MPPRIIMSPASPNPQTGCRLFQLSPELRNYIWTFVLTVELNPNTAQGEAAAVLLTTTPNHPETPTVLSLLQTCRLIYVEACGIFYSSQHIELDVYLGGFVRPHRKRGAAERGVHVSRFYSERRLTAFRKVTIRSASPECLTTSLKLLAYFSNLNVAFLDMDTPELTELLILENLRLEEYFLKKACARLPSSLEVLKLSIGLNAPALPRPIVSEMEEEARRVERVVEVAFSQHRARRE